MQAYRSSRELWTMKEEDDRQSSAPNKGTVVQVCWHCWGRGCQICDDARARREPRARNAMSSVDPIGYRDMAVFSLNNYHQQGSASIEQPVH